MESIVWIIIAILIIFIVGKVLSWPLKVLIKLIINGVLGAILLYLVNFLGGSFGIVIPINGVTALIAGILGIPGVLFLVVLNYLR